MESKLSNSILLISMPFWKVFCESLKTGASSERIILLLTKEWCNFHVYVFVFRSEDAESLHINCWKSLIWRQNQWTQFCSLKFKGWINVYFLLLWNYPFILKWHKFLKMAAFYQALPILMCFYVMCLLQTIYFSFLTDTVKISLEVLQNTLFAGPVSPIFPTDNVFEHKVLPKFSITSSLRIQYSKSERPMLLKYPQGHIFEL